VIRQTLSEPLYESGGPGVMRSLSELISQVHGEGKIIKRIRAFSARPVLFEEMHESGRFSSHDEDMDQVVFEDDNFVAPLSLQPPNQEEKRRNVRDLVRTFSAFARPTEKKE